MTMLPIIDQVTKVAREEGWESSLPGYYQGPADAVTHIVGSAELRRRIGLGIASSVVSFNEWSSRLQQGGSSAESAMDDANNAIGLEIGGRARTYEEVVAMARQAIAGGIAANGSGKGGTPVWFPRSGWQEPSRRSPRSQEALAWEPREPGGGTYAYGGVEHTHLYGTARWREAERLRDLAAAPVGSWSEEDARAAIRSRAYQDRRDPDHAAWQARVRAHFEERVRRSAEPAMPSGRRSDGSGGSAGTVQVAAHIREGHPVTAHQRSAPN